MTQLDEDFRRFRAEGEALAGELGDFQERAGAYYQLYRHSAGNFVFPLIAAHGALWGAGHMRRGMAVSRAATRLAGLDDRESARRLAMVTAFTDTLKDINRQVLVMTYEAYQMTRFHGADPALVRVIPPELIAPLVACHEARRGGWRLNDGERRALFEAAFRWEQRHVVGPRLEAAIPEFDWPLIRTLSLRPPIGFAYFGPLRWLWFRDFGSQPERITHGLRAYDIAVRQGLDRVEETLARYHRVRPVKSRGWGLPGCPDMGEHALQPASRGIPEGPVAVMDAHCALCARGAAWIARNDRDAIFRIIPVQSELGQGLLTRHGLDPDDPASWLFLENGAAWTGLEALARVGWRLGGVWRGLAALRLLPRFVRGPLYRVVARNRYRMFGRADLCAMPDPEVQRRLLT